MLYAARTACMPMCTAIWRMHPHVLRNLPHASLRITYDLVARTQPCRYTNTFSIVPALLVCTIAGELALTLTLTLTLTLAPDP